MINFNQLEKFCIDGKRVENYEIALNDPTETWDVHHKAEILPCGVFSVNDLKAHGLYFRRPPEELILMTHSEHRRMHMKFTRRQISTKGSKNPMFGRKQSAETRAKISATRKKKIKDGSIKIDISYLHTDEVRAKIKQKKRTK